MSYRLFEVVQRLGQPRVLVLGDLILDRYIWGDAERVSQEAPVILLREERQEVRLGGAANVAHMLRGLEVEAAIAGVTGADADGTCVRDELERAGVGCDSLIADAERPTTVKERYIGRAQQRHPHQMLRVDRETRESLGPSVADRLVDSVLSRLDEFDAILVSDYAKGVCTETVLRRVIAAARSAGLPVVIDPANSADYRHYSGATALTPNRLEAGRAVERTIHSVEDAFAAGRLLCDTLDLTHLFLTLDSDGIALIGSDGTAEQFPTRKREVYDITGAGDMVLAVIGAGAAAGIAADDLAQLANIAGGLEVEKVGVATLSREEILGDILQHGGRADEKVCELDHLERRVEARRRLGQRIVFTNGCFDLLHPGHVQFLQEAARHGDALIVAVNSDAGVRRHKGPERPVIPEQHRAAMLAALECVDHVVVFAEDTPHRLLESLKPDILVKGGTTPEVVGRDVVESYGGRVLRLQANGDFSTTGIVDTIRRERAA